MQTSRTHEEIVRRFQAWQSMPTDTDREITERERAFSLYADARDGKPDGTTEGKNMRRRAREPQLGLFN